MLQGADPGFLERGVQPLKKGTHGGASAEGAKLRASRASPRNIWKFQG
jgi:hypothetical protein